MDGKVVVGVVWMCVCVGVCALRDMFTSDISIKATRSTRGCASSEREVSHLELPVARRSCCWA